MNKGPRKTNCPLCGTELGVTIDGQWVPMPLDQYRDHIAMHLHAAKALAHACVACGTPLSMDTLQAVPAAQ